MIETEEEEDEEDRTKRYQRIGFLGQGTFGKVQKAHDTRGMMLDFVIAADAVRETIYKLYARPTA